MRRTGLLAIVLLGSPAVAHGEPARFWLSTSNVDPFAYAMDIKLVEGSTRHLHIWAHPGNSDASSDPPIPASDTLQSISLNLVTAVQGLALEFQSSRVYNPMLDSQTSRYQYVAAGYDLNGSACQGGDNAGRSGICTIGGVSFPVSVPNLPPAAGIGPSCNPAVDNCVNIDGTPAWLIASIAIRAKEQSTEQSDPNSLYLQIGPDGINHVGHFSSDTYVKFGPNALGPYSAATDRNRRNSSDFADAIVSMSPISAVQELRSNGMGGNWAEAFPSPPSWTDDVVIGAESVGEVVNIADSRQAYRTIVDGGRLHFDPLAKASLASDVTVKAAGAVSGAGWIAGDLDLDSWDGTFVAELSGPLNVLGMAKLQGSKLRLPDGFVPRSFPIGKPITILTAGQIDGEFDLAEGHHFGSGIYLDSIQYTSAKPTIDRFTPASVAIVLGREETPALPGDFDGDSDIDGHDFLVWQRGQSLSALSASDLAEWQEAYPRLGDFDHDGDVDGRDFLTWQRGQSLNPLTASDLAVWQDAYPLPGDFDDDGDVDGRDFLAWQRGQSPAPLSPVDLALWTSSYESRRLTTSAFLVPEPAVWSLLISVGFAGTILARR